MLWNFKTAFLLGSLFRWICQASEDVEQTCAVGDETCQANNDIEQPKKENKLVCDDQHDKCSFWADLGECTANPGYMTLSCRKSCELCAEQPKKENKLVCDDQNDKCSFWADLGECTTNPGFMNVRCRKSCELCTNQVHANPLLKFQELSQAADMGVLQKLESGRDVTAEQVSQHIVDSRIYMSKTQVTKDLKELCRNEHELCTVWAILGKCEKKPTFMKISCSPACHSCEYLSIEGRCPLDPNAPQAWGPGDLDQMFTKLVNEPYVSEYSVKVHSSPSMGGPWAITMEDVVTEEEANSLIELGAVEGYEPSSEIGVMRADGSVGSSVNSQRNSTNAWCRHDCYKDEVAHRVIHRLSNITGIDEQNSEFLQLLRYEEGQFYGRHHDYISHEIKRRQGVRILTLYLYLNDVEEGGGTKFDQLGITLMPKRGRAVLWPSVLDDDPNERDDRMTHSALPVEKGIKYGANGWFHMRDFKTPYKDFCK